MDKLVILWTTDNREVAIKMIFMYAVNAKIKNWWKEIEIVIWGPSANLISYDKELQIYLKNLQEKGVKIRACKACADEYNVADILREKLGLEVVYMGEPFTDILKSSQYKVITF
ncbi:MAG: DsrE family protein [Fusobacteriaceae bacterium]